MNIAATPKQNIIPQHRIDSLNRKIKKGLASLAAGDYLSAEESREHSRKRIQEKMRNM